MCHENDTTRLRTAAVGAALAALGATACGAPGGGPRLRAEPPPLEASTAGGTAAPSQRDEEAVALDEGATLDDYVRHALLANPGLEAAFADVLALLADADGAAALPDPRLAYRYYVEEVETRVGPQRQALGLSQAFPWFGTLSLREGVARERALAARRRFEAHRDALAAEVAEAYLEHYYHGRALDAVRRNRDLVRYLEQVARTRYSTGAASHPDVIRAQVELGKLEDRLASLRDHARPVQARLNAALNRPTGTPLPPAGPLRQRTLEASEEQVLAWLREHSPELGALNHEIAGADLGVSLARKDYFPDLALAVDLIDTGEALAPGVAGSGQDALLVGLSFDLPVQRERIAAGVRAARARLRASTLRRAQAENALEARVATILYRLHDAERRVDLYRDTLIPRAEQSISATETAYRGGESDFTDLVDAERLLLEFELAYERALADHGQHGAELERLVGRPLPFREVEGQER